MDTLTGGSGADILDGGGGTDTADYSASTQAVQISLDGTAGSGGHADGDTLSNIEYVLGSSHNDSLNGDAGDNGFAGGAGADAIDGGAGSDWAYYYTSSNDGVTVHLDGTAGTSGHADGDTLTNIENISGSRNADSLYGDNGDNILDGAAGNDVIFGGFGDDTLIGGAGADTLYGGDGTDTADYSSSNENLTIYLDNRTTADGDRLFDIENITGGDGNDTLYGDGGNNALNGGAGDDVITGGAGADAIDGGSGNDTASYEASNAAVRVYLDGTAGVGGHAQGDTLTNIEHVSGSSHGDYLYGSGGNDHLEGNAGDDVILGHGGNDTLSGGSGNDSLNGGNGADTLNGGAGNDTLFGNEGVDTLTGGTGADSFVLTLANPQNNNERISSVDTILDFNSADGDRIRIDTIGGTENSLGDLGLSVGFYGGHTNLIFDQQVVMIINDLDHTLVNDWNFGSYFEVV